MSAKKTERNNRILELYYDKDLSIYQICKELGYDIEAPRVWKIIKTYSKEFLEQRKEQA